MVQSEKTKLVYPDGKETLYEYDKSGELIKLNDDGNDVTYEYDPMGRLAKKHLPNGVDTEYSYNEIGRLECLKHIGQKGLELSYAFQYDLAGNKVVEERKRSDFTQESGTFQYTYDKLSRLIAVQKDGQSVREYEYDGFGNRIRKREHAGSTVLENVYRYNENNQLVSEADTSIEKRYQYDHRGNVSRVMSGSELLQEFAFDSVNQMVSSTCYMDDVVKKAVYGYNGIEKRVEQSTYEGKTGRLKDVRTDELNPMKKIQYTLDLTRDYYNMLGLEEEMEQCNQRFIWDGNVVGMEQDGGDSFYLQDDLGSVLNLLGKDGESIEQLAYGEFGQVRNRSGKRMVQPFGFTGYQMDEVSGLYFAQARRYDAGSGRFVSEDKIKGNTFYPDSLNTYSYCNNKPNDYVDVNGQFAILAVIATAALIGGTCGFVGSVTSEAVTKGGLKKVNWRNVAVDSVSGMINGGVAAIPGVGTVAVVATGAATGIAGYESKNLLNGDLKNKTIKEHIAGGIIYGSLGGVANYAGTILGPKPFWGDEVVSSANIVATNEAIDTAICQSGKDANIMLAKDLFRAQNIFNITRTSTVTIGSGLNSCLKGDVYTQQKMESLFEFIKDKIGCEKQ